MDMHYLLHLVEQGAWLLVVCVWPMGFLQPTAGSQCVITHPSSIN